VLLPVGAGGENFRFHCQLREAIGARLAYYMGALTAGFDVADRPQQLTARDDDRFVAGSQEFFAAIHDLANAVKAEEAYYATNEAYIDIVATGPTNVALPPMAVSGTVNINMKAADGSFEGTAISSRGSGKIFRYDSITDTYLND